MVGKSEGLDLSDLERTSPEEVNANLIRVWSWRGPLYEMYANSLMLDYAPDFAKLPRWGSDFFGRPSIVNVITLSTQNLHSYMMLGWETGILNEFHTLRRNGMTKAQLMEVVMFSQLHAGMRGLGHVYHAVGNLLPVWEDPKQPAPFPEGWAADPDAFKCGLDLSTRALTDQDRKNLTDWYEKTIGSVPIKTLPKQVAPYLMLRHHTITGSREGLREAALLAKAWGITPEWIIQGIMGTAMYFTGLEGLYAPFDAVDDLL